MLKPIITKDEHSALAESVRAHFVETDDGNFKLETEIREHPDTLALRNAHAMEKDEVKKLKELLTKFDGIDPNEIATLKRTTDIATGVSWQ